MKRITYTYSVIRYIHDSAVGESLNIGVVLYAATIPFIESRFEMRFERLSNTFAKFDGEHYKRTLAQISAEIDRLSDRSSSILLIPTQQWQDVGGIVSEIIPDEGMSFQAGPILAGITDDPVVALDEIFQRMVLSQYEFQKNERRTDDEVWANIYHQLLVSRKVSSKLRPWKPTVEDFELKFDHAFKNEKWHVLEPVSLDYVKADSIQSRATKLLGLGTALQGRDDLGTLYLLLGKPKSADNLKNYIKAKNLLHKMPIKHELIEEDEAASFADKLAAEMREHGLIDDEK